MYSKPRRKYTTVNLSKKRSKSFYHAYKITENVDFKKCSVCNNIIHDPSGLFLLSCLRPVCATCKGGVTPIREHCASCQERTFAKVSVDSVRQNHFIASRVSKNPENIFCSKEHHAASCYCFNCRQFLCGECQSDHMASRESHEIMTLDEITEQPVRDWNIHSSCSRHPGYPVTHCRQSDQQYELKCVVCKTENNKYEPDENYLETDSAFSHEVTKLQMLSERLAKQISVLCSSLRCQHRKEPLKRHITETFERFEEQIQEKYGELKQHTTNDEFSSDAEMQAKLKEARDYAQGLFTTSKHDFLSLVPRVQKRLGSLLKTMDNPVTTHTMSARNYYILEQRSERLQSRMKYFGELASKPTTKRRGLIRPPPVIYTKPMKFSMNTNKQMYQPLRLQTYSPKVKSSKRDTNVKTYPTVRLQKYPNSGANESRVTVKSSVSPNPPYRDKTKTRLSSKIPNKNISLNRNPVQTKTRLPPRTSKGNVSLDSNLMHRDQTKAQISSKENVSKNRNLYPLQTKTRPSAKALKENSSLVSKTLHRDQRKIQLPLTKPTENLALNRKPLHTPQTKTRLHPKKSKENSSTVSRQLQLCDIKVELPAKKHVAITLKSSRKRNIKPKGNATTQTEQARSKPNKDRVQPERLLPTPEKPNKDKMQPERLLPTPDCLRPPHRIGKSSKSSNKGGASTARTPKVADKKDTSKSRTKETSDAFRNQLQRMQISNYLTGTQKNDNKEWIFKSKSGGSVRSSDKKARKMDKKDDTTSRRILPLRSRCMLVPGSPPGSLCSDDLLLDGNGDAFLGQLVVKQSAVSQTESENSKRNEETFSKDEEYTSLGYSSSMGKDDEDSQDTFLEDEEKMKALMCPLEYKQDSLQNELLLADGRRPDASNGIPEHENTSNNQVQEDVGWESKYSKDNFYNTLERLRSDIKKMYFKGKDSDFETSVDNKNEIPESKPIDIQVETPESKHSDSIFETNNNKHLGSQFETIENKHPDSQFEITENKHPDSQFGTTENNCVDSPFDIFENKHPDSQFETIENNNLYSRFDIFENKHPDSKFETTENKHCDSKFETTDSNRLDSPYDIFENKHPDSNFETIENKQLGSQTKTTESTIDTDSLNGDENLGNVSFTHITETGQDETNNDSKYHIQATETKDKWKSNNESNLKFFPFSHTSDSGHWMEETCNYTMYDSQDPGKADQYKANDREYPSNSSFDHISNTGQFISENEDVNYYTHDAAAWNPSKEETTKSKARNTSKTDDNKPVFVEAKNVNVISYETPALYSAGVVNYDKTYIEVEKGDAQLNQTPDYEASTGINADSFDPEIDDSDINQTQHTHIYPHVNVNNRPQESGRLPCNVYSDVDSLFNRDLGLHATSIRQIYVDEMKKDEKVNTNKMDSVLDSSGDKQMEKSLYNDNDMMFTDREAPSEERIEADDIHDKEKNKYKILTGSKDAPLYSQRDRSVLSEQADVDTQIKSQESPEQEDKNAQTKSQASPEQVNIDSQITSQESSEQANNIHSQTNMHPGIKSETELQVSSKQPDIQEDVSKESPVQDDKDIQRKSRAPLKEADVDSEREQTNDIHSQTDSQVTSEQPGVKSETESQVSSKQPDSQKEFSKESPELDDKKAKIKSQEQSNNEEDVSKHDENVKPAVEEKNYISSTKASANDLETSPEMAKDEHVVATVMLNAVNGSSSEIAKVQVFDQDLIPAKHGELKGKVHDPNGSVAVVDAEDVNDLSSIYRLVYCPEVVGVHKLELTFQGKRVSGQMEFTSLEEDLCLDAVLTFSGHSDITTKCPHLKIDDEAIYKEYEVSEDGTLSNKKKVIKDNKTMFKKFRGGVSTQPLSSEIQYWEITVDFVLKTKLIGLNILLEASITDRDVIDKEYKCEGQKKAWGVSLARCKQHNEVCLRMWGDGVDGQHTSFPIANEPNEIATLRLGFLLMPEKRRLVVVDIGQNYLPFVINGVETEVPLWTAWGVYNADLSDVTLKIVSGNEIVIDSQKSKYLFDTLTQEESEEEEKPGTIANAFSSWKRRFSFM
ncbi:uncharacterized protein LOC121369569 [Gigantopelta aegis]|uniref:uncharacterized protein LOC121369569 n=1 Tax=Gigantopelta aegis TaxID=1735272 RepID=UPI001B88C944|nr:uncharacterized protein LOC121369569 [Gigantopelta aegis]XP_041350572.1 uncharacterized protein LOC121369569 [Gigantopelta aegis]